MQVYPVFIKVLHILEGASPVLTKLHYIADIIGRSVNVSIHYGLLCTCDKGRLWVVCRVVDKYGCAVGQVYLVDNRGCRSYKVEVVFTL